MVITNDDSNMWKPRSSIRDCILFYRLGDFYEMFFEDALTASKGTGDHADRKGMRPGRDGHPCAAFPIHAVDTYINRLSAERATRWPLRSRWRTPSWPKGLVKREVIRVVTPGTITSAARHWTRRKNNYLMGIVYIGEPLRHVQLADITTGDFLVTEVDRDREICWMRSINFPRRRSSATRRFTCPAWIWMI